MELILLPPIKACKFLWDSVKCVLYVAQIRVYNNTNI